MFFKEHKYLFLENIFKILSINRHLIEKQQKKVTANILVVFISFTIGGFFFNN